MSRNVSRVALWVLGVAVLPLLVAGATLQHTHDAPGFHNLEHDLTFYAASGAAAVTALAAAVLVVLLATPLPLLAARRAAARPSASAHSRAPPAR